MIIKSYQHSRNGLRLHQMQMYLHVDLLRRSGSLTPSQILRLRRRYSDYVLLRRPQSEQLSLNSWKNWQTRKVLSMWRLLTRRRAYTVSESLIMKRNLGKRLDSQDLN